MASADGRALRGGRCDVCGRCCIWCGGRRELGGGGDLGEGRGDLRGGRLSPAPVHPSRSPVRFDDLGDGDGGGNGRRDSGELLGAHPRPAYLQHSRSPIRLDEVHGGDGGERCFHNGDRRRRTWWSRSCQRVLTEGVDFAPDSQEGPGDEFELLTDSDDDARRGSLSLLPDDDEVVPETEFQELEADGSSKQIFSMDGEVLLSSADGSAKESFTREPGVSSDAETKGENASGKVDVRGHSEAESEWEDFKAEWEDFKAEWEDFLCLLFPGYTQYFKRKRARAT